ncbi:sigma factor-like helix-turn-helix DNA-binding protein [Pedobacter aquatilis]|uniref:sigma factor-like helix-turn-helix DNA-binding protein n=1 Tax=Pedobacter aquatilis TaxID=351343 RepID=UPI00338E153B
MHEIESYRHQEIARLLNIQENASRTYMTRAKSRLRILYEKRMSCPNAQASHPPHCPHL